MKIFGDGNQPYSLFRALDGDIEDFFCCKFCIKTYVGKPCLNSLNKLVQIRGYKSFSVINKTKNPSVMVDIMYDPIYPLI